MIGNLLHYYDVYLILSPYLIFWFIYVFFFLEVLYLKISRKYKIFYFPEETKWTVVNLLVVLPKRMAFRAIYFINPNFLFSIENIKTILKVLFIVILVGIPFIFIRIILLYIKHRNVDSTLYHLMNNADLKLILVDGNIIRNMKKIETGAIISREIYSIAEPKMKMGLTQSKLGPHATTYSAESKVGVLFTSKKQTDKLIVKEETDSYGYAQTFGENILVEKYQIKSQQLKELLQENGVFYGIKANKIIMNTNEKVIKYNHNGKQSWIKINSELKKQSSTFIESCGGKSRVEEALEFHTYYENTFREGRKMFLNLENADKSTKYEIFKKNQEIYNNLKVLNNQNLGPTRNIQIKKLLDKIHDLLGPDVP